MGYRYEVEWLDEHTAIESWYRVDTGQLVARRFNHVLDRDATPRVVEVTKVEAA